MSERKSSKLPKVAMDSRRRWEPSECCVPLALEGEAECAVLLTVAVPALASLLVIYWGVRGDADESDRSASECESSGTTPPPYSRLLAPLLVDRGPAAKLMGERVPEEPSLVPGLNLAPLPMATLPRALTPVARVEAGGCCIDRTWFWAKSDSMGVVGWER